MKSFGFKILFLFASLVFLASAVAHFSTFAGVNPQRVFPPVFLLHFLTIILFFPVVMIGKRVAKQEGHSEPWAGTMKSAPKWMKTISGAAFCYSIISFLFVSMVLMQGASPSVINGEKVLNHRGHVVQKLTDKEYEKFESYEVRLFSGHWLAFSSVSTAVFASESKRLSLEESC